MLKVLHGTVQCKRNVFTKFFRPKSFLKVQFFFWQYFTYGLLIAYEKKVVTGAWRKNVPFKNILTQCRFNFSLRFCRYAKASGFGAQIGLKPTTTSDGFPKDLQPRRQPQRNYLKSRPKQEKLLLILGLTKNCWNLISNEDRGVMSSEHLGLHKTSK